jgi:hypothetical protein
MAQRDEPSPPPHDHNGGDHPPSRYKSSESMLRDGLSPEDQAAVDREMARHGPRVQAWPLHRSKVVYFIRCVRPDRIRLLWSESDRFEGR